MLIEVRATQGGAEEVEAARQGVEAVLRDQQRTEVDVSVYLTDDAEIAELNAQYRREPSPTDVLSFPQQGMNHEEASLPRSSGGETVLGDIVISLETARRQAQERGVPAVREVTELAAHATLHLLGYDDATEEGLDEMQRLAAHALARFEAEQDHGG